MNKYFDDFIVFAAFVLGGWAVAMAILGWIQK